MLKEICKISIDHNDYFEISFDVFFINFVDYAKHICYFQVFDSTSSKTMTVGSRFYIDFSFVSHQKILNITSNKWYTFRIVVDNKNNVFNVYQDDVLIDSGNTIHYFTPTIVCVGNIDILDRVYNYAYVDNISIKTQVEDEEPTSKYPKFDKLNLPKPLQQGYSQTLKPIVLRSEMTDGSIRQRLLNPSATGTISCTLQLTVEQLAIFRKFYEEELDYGANWFVLPLLSTETNDIVSKLVRIQNGELQLKLLHRNQITSMYQIQLKLDVDETVEV